MGMQVGQNKGSISEMNVVPLIDTLLVLLIIFMVITPLMSHGLPTLLPQSDRSIERPVSPDIVIVVQVGSNGSLKINQEDVTWDSLESRLQEVFKHRAERIAFVRGDAPVEFAQVARAISLMRSAGINQVGLLTSRVEPAR